ncbi:MAG: DegV family protein [Chloroflexi bacterium]|nr:DegV family protein [Chloroflexota bacterium]
MTIAIVTDSTADLPGDLVEKHGITVVPLIVRFGMEEFKDGVEIDSDEFYRRLEAESDLPTTSQPSPGDFAEVYQKLAADHDGIVSVHLSGKLSQTINSANQGAREVTVDGLRIETIDTGQATIPLGLIVIEAAISAASGATIDEVVAATKDAMGRARFYGMVDTLEYLVKGGRIGRAKGFIGGLLKVTPIITFEDGESSPVASPRTRRRAIEQIKALVEEAAPFDHLAVYYSTEPEELEKLSRDLAHLAPKDGVITSRIGAVVGTYAGPGSLGVGFIRKKSG